jgi:hypothetical protein
MTQWICNFQVSPQNYESEKKKIFEIGRVNGYPADQIQKIIRKYEDTTSLSPIEPRKGKRISILFYPGINPSKSSFSLKTTKNIYLMVDKFG